MRGQVSRRWHHRRLYCACLCACCQHSYESGRDEQSFVDYLNEKAGTHRVAGGGLNDQAGRVPELDQVAAKFAEEPSHSVRVAQRRRARCTPV